MFNKLKIAEFAPTERDRNNREESERRFFDKLAKSKTNIVSKGHDVAYGMHATLEMDSGKTVAPVAVALRAT